MVSTLFTVLMGTILMFLGLYSLTVANSTSDEKIVEKLSYIFVSAITLSAAVLFLATAALERYFSHLKGFIS